MKNKLLISISALSLICGFAFNKAAANQINGETKANANTSKVAHDVIISISNVDSFASDFDITKYEKEHANQKVNFHNHISLHKDKFSDLLDTYPYMKAISSYNDEKTANMAIKETIKYNAPKIVKWINTKRSDKISIKKEFSDSIGYGMKRKNNAETITKTALVVLVRDMSLPSKFYVKTSYPLIND